MAILWHLALLIPTFATILKFTSAQLELQLPKLPGNYQVGTVAFELKVASNPRDIMASFFYPADRSCSNFPLAPAFPPASLAYIAAEAGLPPGFPVTVTTQAHLKASISSTDFPILIFSTGYGVSRLLYTAMAEDLASLGYIVIVVDHPLDASFIEYPDGRFVNITVTNYENFDAYIPFIDARVQDVRTVLDSLSNTTFSSQIPGLVSRGKIQQLQTSKVGILGHSLGGATAASAMLSDKRFVAGVNLDGSIIGNVTTIGLSKPYLIMENYWHNRTYDATWAEFWTHLRGFKREIRVAQSQHGSYSDYLVLLDELIAAGIPVPPELKEGFGLIDGKRMLEIESAYVDAFFGKWLKGKSGKLLDGPSKMFPEVTFFN
ncbi:platelet-activating factor acetylhydrolase-like protein plasma/intracellular [Rhexocercosporidium sp. MPI-PUGE-AT-0058]|nr:platelet-activating factor acetylhydrolase-like protein plasma/intracellular [Rhexocercosporidium sp. MPI-PUGE-AT-0058]